MRDKSFQIFVDKFGEATHRTSVPEESLLKFQSVFPSQLLSYWQEEGWSAYANGLFWTVNPEEYDGLVELWLSGTPFAEIDRYRVVARSGFGDLYLWGEHNSRNFIITCADNCLIASEKELRTPAKNPDVAAKAFFASKTRDAMDKRDITGKELFERALKKLGPLAPNEVYGFEPALAAGGGARLEKLTKVDLFVHLSILRELAETRIFSFGR
ncbi:MAG TPA: GAD-like domain-containing protein [Myxococcaceae bacterium]|nr:GAD-like domain-containing protein [Myxococcaceae bacterium]